MLAITASAALVVSLSLAVVPPGAGAHNSAHLAKHKKPRCKPGKKVRKHLAKCPRKHKPGTPGTPTSGTPTSGTPTSGTPTSGTPTSGTPAPSPTQQDPTTRFHAMFDNSGWDRQSSTNTSDPQPQESLYNFCANGKFYERYTSGLTGTDYMYSGTWQLVSTQAGSVAGYNTVEGHVTADSSDQYGDSKQFDLYVDVSEQAPNTGFINQQEFSRVAPQAC
jgi:hypothetical protein